MTHPDVVTAAKMLLDFGYPGHPGLSRQWDGLPDEMKAEYILRARAVLKLALSIEPSDAVMDAPQPSAPSSRRRRNGDG